MPSTATPTPLSKLRVTRKHIPAHGLLPNSEATGKPLMIYHSAFAAGTGAAAIEAHLKSVGAVTPRWRYTMYSTTHFHSSAHEVLAVARGRAQLCFGGEANPDRAEIEASAGDVLVVPAGVAHRLLVDLRGGQESFEMVGSYPPGYDWDMCYGREDESGRVLRIRDLAWFTKDPVYGAEGPVLDSS